MRFYVRPAIEAGSPTARQPGRERADCVRGSACLMIVQWTATAVRPLTSIHDYIGRLADFARVSWTTHARSQQIVLFRSQPRGPEHGSESIRVIIGPITASSIRNPP